MINAKVNWPGAVVGSAVGSIAALMITPSFVKDPILLPEDDTPQGIRNVQANVAAKQSVESRRSSITLTVGVAGMVLGGFLLR